jgi:hypothetical protein
MRWVADNQLRGAAVPDFGGLPNPPSYEKINIDCHVAPFD